MLTCTGIRGKMQALHDVVQAGYVRYIGMSSCWAWQRKSIPISRVCAYLEDWPPLVQAMQSAFQWFKWITSSGVQIIPDSLCDPEQAHFIHFHAESLQSGLSRGRTGDVSRTQGPCTLRSSVGPCSEHHGPLRKIASWHWSDSMVPTCPWVRNAPTLGTDKARKSWRVASPSAHLLS